MDFKDEAGLQLALDDLVKRTVVVKAWFFTPKDKPDEGAIQMHNVKGEAKKQGTKKESEVPF